MKKGELSMYSLPVLAHRVAHYQKQLTEFDCIAVVEATSQGTHFCIFANRSVGEKMKKEFSLKQYDYEKHSWANIS